VLKRSYSESVARKAIGQLPDSLDETYERMLLNIPEESRQYLWRTLAIMCSNFAPSDLTLEALASAVSQDEPADEGINTDDLKEIAGCFINITKSAGQDLNQERVSLAHYTIKEYIFSQRLTQKAAYFQLSPYTATAYHLRTVLAGARRGLSGKDTSPFSQHCRDTWRQLLHHADVFISSDSELLGFVINLLGPDSNIFFLTEDHARYFDGSGRLKWGAFGPNNEVAVLAKLVSEGLYAITATYLDRFPVHTVGAMCSFLVSTIEAGGISREMTLLAWVAINCGSEFLALLFHRGANDDGGRALMYTLETFSRSLKIYTAVKTLIECGSDVNQEGLAVTPLQIAVRRGLVPLVNVLVNAQANPFETGNRDGWAPQRLSVTDCWISPLEYIMRQPGSRTREIALAFLQESGKAPAGRNQCQAAAHF